MSEPEIGFVAMGPIGGAMVGRLPERALALNVVADRSRADVDADVDAAVVRGAAAVATAREAAAASDIVAQRADPSADVEAPMRGSDGVMAGLRRAAAVIGFATTLPGRTRALGAEVASATGTMVAALPRRTPSHARQQRLNIMTSGIRDAAARVRPAPRIPGENVVHLGAPGAGHTDAISNDFLSMAHADAGTFATADVAGTRRRQAGDDMAGLPLHVAMTDFSRAGAVDGNPMPLAVATGNGAGDTANYQQVARDSGVVTRLAWAPPGSLKAGIAEGRADATIAQMPILSLSHHQPG